MKKRKKKENIVKSVLKQARKESRESEIRTHGKPVNYQKIATSKKTYNRKKNKPLTDED
ncbi:MAG: hypothetical protein ACK5KP_09545 [Paludibacteraceae bacterium]